MRHWGEKEEDWAADTVQGHCAVGTRPLTVFYTPAEIPDAAGNAAGDGSARVQALSAPGAHACGGVHCVPQGAGALLPKGELCDKLARTLEARRPCCIVKVSKWEYKSSAFRDQLHLVCMFVSFVNRAHVLRYG